MKILSWSSNCFNGGMAPQVRLLSPVIGFYPATNRVVTIPTGTILTVSGFKVDLGVCPASWAGHEIFAQSADIEENCVPVFNTSPRR